MGSDLSEKPKLTKIHSVKPVAGYEPRWVQLGSDPRGNLRNVFMLTRHQFAEFVTDEVERLENAVMLMASLLDELKKGINQNASTRGSTTTDGGNAETTGETGTSNPDAGS